MGTSETALADQEKLQNMCFYQTNPPFFGGFFIANDYEDAACTGNRREKSVGSFSKTNPPGGVFRGAEGIFGGKRTHRSAFAKASAVALRAMADKTARLVRLGGRFWGRFTRNWVRWGEIWLPGRAPCRGTRPTTAGLMLR